MPKQTSQNASMRSMSIAIDSLITKRNHNTLDHLDHLDHFVLVWLHSLQLHLQCLTTILFFKIFCLKRFNYRGRIHRRVVFDCWTQIHSGSDQWLLAMLSNVCEVALWRGWLLCNDLLPPARAIICMLMANGPLSSQLIRPGYHCCWSSPDNTISNCLSASDNRFRNIVLDAESLHWQLFKSVESVPLT